MSEGEAEALGKSIFSALKVKSAKESHFERKGVPHQTVKQGAL